MHDVGQTAANEDGCPCGLAVASGSPIITNALDVLARHAKVTPMKTQTLPTKKRALAYMAEWNIRGDAADIGGHAGYVSFWEGKPCGWALQPKPSEYRPGVIIVDVQTGAQFEGVGGSYGAGCERWEQLSHES